MNSDNPLVTIYIPSRNYGKYLGQAIKSVENQTYKDWELIIIDEDSKDNTYEVAEASFKRNYEKIKLLKNNKPLGLQRAANKVLELANGKYMMRLDADDWLDENALSCMVKKLENNPDSVMVFSGYFYTDEEGNVIGTEIKHSLSGSDLMRHPPPHGACTMFKTRSLKSAGGYLESANAQDGWDLWYKLIGKSNVEVISIPLFYYRQHNLSLSKDNSKLLNARKVIFNNLSRSTHGDFVPKVAAVLPIKENYDYIEGMPFKKYMGKSLLELAIHSVQDSNKVSEIIITSTSKDVLTAAEQEAKKGTIDNFIFHKRDDDHKTGSIMIRNFFKLPKKSTLINMKFIQILSYTSAFMQCLESQHILIKQ